MRYNKVFGYYLEVSRANLHLVPADYTRKQTLVNAERFITGDLKEYESRVLGAEEARLKLETALFQELRRQVRQETIRLKQVARALGILDVAAALAELAALHQYNRPRVVAEPTLLIRQGRHPVIERVLASGSFVPNDITLDADSQVLIVTGPNMSGKSTILRQVALITLLAHLGSFVPAAEAVIGLTDRIFTRVGAVDDIGRGQSTFLVEMHETARILHQATPRSLVILDEIGRGTSTFDGLALAWAVAEHLHDLNGAGVKTLFATHYQELTELSRLKPRVKNFQVLVAESAGRYHLPPPPGPRRRLPELRYPGGQTGRRPPGSHRPGPGSPGKPGIRQPGPHGPPPPGPLPPPPDPGNPPTHPVRPAPGRAAVSNRC